MRSPLIGPQPEFNDGQLKPKKHVFSRDIKKSVAEEQYSEMQDIEI